MFKKTPEQKIAAIDAKIAKFKQKIGELDAEKAEILTKMIPAPAMPAPVPPLPPPTQ